jgi:hypothetical protein
MIVSADYKQIRLHLGWNKRKSGFISVEVTYLRTNFRIRPKWSLGWAGLNSKILACADF